MAYVKHLIECNCILPQFRNVYPAVFHKFVVFSELNDSDASIMTHFAQCNNCAAIHKVTEVGESITLAKETLTTLPTIEDLKTAIPEKFVSILESNKCELPTWQEVKYILDHGQWGTQVLLSREQVDDMIMGKFMIILSGQLFRVDSFNDKQR